MKRYLISLSVISAILIGLITPAYQVVAQEWWEEGDAAKACKDYKPTFAEQDEDYNFVALTKLQTAIDNGEIEWNYAKFLEVFEEVKDEYHKYAECIFNYTEKAILGGVGLSQGTMQATTPNIDPSNIPILGKAIDWMTSAACLTPTELGKIKNATISKQMLDPLLETHKLYSEYLNGLIVLYQFEGRENAIADEDLSLTAIDQLTAMASAYTGINRMVDLEKENALVAMDIAFKSVKELRMAFFMHVHFQCMLNNLDKYRKWLEDIRKIVEGFPSMLLDASMTK